MSCCPELSWPYLESSHNEEGTKKEVDGVSFYQVGEGKGNKKGLIICPDVWGWGGGRTRNTADMLANAGFNVIVLKLLAPPMDATKCTDGDGIPPDFIPSPETFPTLVTYLKTLPYEKISPSLFIAVKTMESDGVTSIGVIGACWGAWVLARFLADSNLPASVKAGVSWHPSIQLEEPVFGGDPVSLLKKAQRPMKLLPTVNDPEGYKEGGNFYEAIKSVQPNSEVLLFDEMSHGFTTRGDMSDAKVKRDVELAMTTTVEYFQKFC